MQESDLASVLLLLVKNILVMYIDVLPFRPRMVCQGMGIFLGGLYGVIISNKPNFERFNALGKDYLLGRIARDEVLHWGSEAKALEIYEKRELD